MEIHRVDHDSESQQLLSGSSSVPRQATESIKAGHRSGPSDQEAINVTISNSLDARIAHLDTRG